MTTPTFNAHVGPRARALNAIKVQHCAPPAYRPNADVKGHTECPKCKGTIKFTVRASDGGTTGKCSTAGCLNWSE